MTAANVDMANEYGRGHRALRLLTVAILGVSVGALTSASGYVDRVLGRDSSHHLLSTVKSNLETAMDARGNTILASSRQLRVQQSLKRAVHVPQRSSENQQIPEQAQRPVYAMRLAHYHVEAPRKPEVTATSLKTNSIPLSTPPRIGEARSTHHISRALVGRVHSVIKKYAPRHKSPGSLAHAIVQESLRQGVDPLFVAAVVKSESTFNSSARSHRGAQGLMQIMPATGAWLSQKHELPRGRLTDPGYNLRLGISYLKYLEESYGGNRVFALVAYNWGPGHVNSAAVGKRKIPKECMQYALKIINDYKRWSSGII